MSEGSPQRSRTALVALLPLAVVGLLYFAYRGSVPVPTQAPTPAPVPAPDATSVSGAALPDATGVSGETEAADLPAEPTAEAPGFDVVRVEPDGSAAVVGTAEPGATVTIYADDAPLAEAEADAQGNFVAIFKIDPSPEPRALTLGAVTPEGGAASSEDVIVLLPRAPAVPEPETELAAEAAAARAGQEPTAGATPTGAQEAALAPPEVAGEAPAPVEAAQVVLPEAGEAAADMPDEPVVVATAILRSDGVEVTPAAPLDAGGARRVTLGSVSYAAAGEVTLAGVGTAGAVVRAYVDDTFTTEAQVAADGRWSMQLGDVAEGIYRLRIDQLASNGKVASRVETPFQRDYPRPPPPRPGGAHASGPMVSVTVQPGNNLWTLARTHYGSGVSYTQIFTANSDQIRDPDLIYPGQIFNIPAPNAVE